MPPLAGPVAGDTFKTDGAGPRYVNACATCTPLPSGLSTVRVTTPGAWAGVRATRRVVVTLETVAATVPNRTTTPAWKFVPAIVTSVPPAMDPLAGAKLVTVGRVEA